MLLLHNGYAFAKRLVQYDFKLLFFDRELSSFKEIFC